MPKISGTRVQSGDEAGGSKNMRSGAMGSGGGMSGKPRADKPVTGTTNASTVKVSSAEKTTRPSSGGGSPKVGAC